MERPDWYDDGFDKDLYAPTWHKVLEFVIGFLIVFGCMFISGF